MSELDVAGSLPGSLADVMPAVALSLGLSPHDLGPSQREGSASREGRVEALAESAGSLGLPRARTVVVLLVDGLGELLLRANLAHAPYLRKVLADHSGQAVIRTLSCGFPSTTATSMATLGTGVPSGRHGMVGLEVLDPDRDLLVNHLRWETHTDPHRWQPLATIFERVAAAGRDVVRIGPAYFDGSGLTEATQRGGRFAAADTLDQRVDAALLAARTSRRGALISVYWGQVDKVGHQRGCAAPQWADELEAVDAGVRRLVRGLGPDAILVVTADHGMVDVPLHDRVDLAREPDLTAGIHLLGGEPRALHLYCEAGAVPEVLQAWRERLGSRMELLIRAEAVSRGLFGDVSARTLPRIGDIVAIATSSIAVADSRVTRPEYLAMIGQHGALTEAETSIPLIAVPGGWA